MSGGGGGRLGPSRPWRGGGGRRGRPRARRFFFSLSLSSQKSAPGCRRSAGSPLWRRACAWGVARGLAECAGVRGRGRVCVCGRRLRGARRLRRPPLRKKEKISESLHTPFFRSFLAPCFDPPPKNALPRHPPGRPAGRPHHGRRRHHHGRRPHGRDGHRLRPPRKGGRGKRGRGGGEA